jgi:hypothetical protein
MAPLIILCDLLSCKEAIFADYLELPDIALEKPEVECNYCFFIFFVGLLNFCWTEPPGAARGESFALLPLLPLGWRLLSFL